MRPYDSNFIKEKLEEYNNKINEIKINDYEIKKKVCSLKSDIGYLYEKDNKIEEKSIELSKGNDSYMILNSREIQGSYEFIKYARGKVGVVGLGLGYTVEEIAKKEDVTEVVVYEISSEIIEMYKSNFEKNKKIRIVQGDAYKAKSEQFDFFLVDIYEYKLSKKVVEDYKLFNKLHKIEEYSFWGVEHFLLSCRYEEIVWVFIPELWMDMTKDLSRILGDSGYIEYYKKLDDKVVSDILKEFKVILNEGEEDYL
ncbi:MAG: hypothetical protein E7214_03125 [Clostridium sp.]|nr:hypothetical protein [Clostridium sp.]